MARRKKSPNTGLILRYILVPPIIGLFISIVTFFEAFRSFTMIAYVLFYSYCIGLPCIALFEVTEKRIDRRFPWLKNPFKRLVISVLIEVFLVLIILVMVNIIFVIIFRENIDALIKKIADGYLWAISITVIGITLANSANFFKNWRQSAINEEILKREKLAIEYEALRNQVNPHFLFNSLTALTTLVHQDPDKAVAFIRKFSDVYRYVLENRDQDIVSLRSEIYLIKNMAYLYHYRHGDNLQIIFDITPFDEKYIIPMALQMLLENALKHNVISEEKPLIVRISEKDGYIEVWNNLQPKSNISDSNRVGLSNIRLRYSYLSDKEVLVEKTGEYFRVRIPILYQS